MSPIFFVLAITLPGLLYAAGRAVYGLFAEESGLPWMYLPERPEHLGALLFVPIGEEIGWRGFALPRLSARHGAHRATAILGLLWGAWHLPMFISVGTSPVDVVVAVALIAIGTVTYTWFFRRTGGSPMHETESSAPLYILTSAFAVLGVALLAFDRRAFQGRSPEAPGTPPAP